MHSVTSDLSVPAIFLQTHPSVCTLFYWHDGQVIQAWRIKAQESQTKTMRWGFAFLLSNYLLHCFSCILYFLFPFYLIFFSSLLYFLLINSLISFSFFLPLRSYTMQYLSFNTVIFCLFILFITVTFTCLHFLFPLLVIPFSLTYLFFHPHITWYLPRSLLWNFSMKFNTNTQLRV